MKVMKSVIFFSISVLLLGGCQKPEEQELINLDEMVFAEGELTSEHLAGDPLESPQELLIKEPKIIE